MADDVNALKRKLSITKFQKRNLEKRYQLLSGMTQQDGVTAWCADLSEELSGTVGTIEVPGERGRTQIKPGGGESAAYNASEDGILVPALASTAANVYLNRALMPAWQRYKPTYRYGVITSLDQSADTCSVTLDAATSSQQNLDINNGYTSLNDVPIEYMDCNSLIFEIGDHVLIQFVGQSWESPKVIGFYSDPKACEIAVQITINGNKPQWRKLCRLFHPDYGYSDTQLSTATGVINLANFTLPGGNLDDCYLEIECYNYNNEASTRRDIWLHHYEDVDALVYLPDEGDQATTCGTYAVLNAYDYVMCGSGAATDPETAFTLADLSSSIKKTVRFFNTSYNYTSDRFTVEINGDDVEQGTGIEFFWDGLSWTKTSLVLDSTAHAPQRWSYYIAGYQPALPIGGPYYDYLLVKTDTYRHNMYDIGTAPYKLLTRVMTWRSTGTIAALKTADVTNGRIVVDITAKTLQCDATEGTRWMERGMSCQTPIYIGTSVDTAANSEGGYPPTPSLYRGASTEAIGGGWYVGAGAFNAYYDTHTMSLASFMPVSNKYGHSPAYTAFNVTGSFKIGDGALSWICYFQRFDPEIYIARCGVEDLITLQCLNYAFSMVDLPEGGY